MKTYAFGVDIGGTTVKMGLFKVTGELLETWEIPTRTEENGEAILPDIAASVEAKLAEKKIEKSDVEGIGMGVPGPISPDGTVLKCVNLGWGVFNVETELSKLTVVLQGDVTSKDIFDAAKAGDQVALKMVDDLGRMLGKAAAAIACVVNPEAFVIGGGVAKAGEILLDAIRRHYKIYAFHASADTPFKAATLGNNAGIFGGVKLVLAE